MKFGRSFCKRGDFTGDLAGGADFACFVEEAYCNI